MGRRPTDKRERLVATAVELFHQQGYAGTSLADVAKSAGMSPGSVFYYFRTKEELALAVLDSWHRELTEYLATIAGEGDGWQRLERFVAEVAERREGYASLGCPLAGLARDLRRESDALRAEVPRVYTVQQDWVRAQFAEVGFAPDEAEAHALFLMAGYNGVILLGYAQGDESLIASGVAVLQEWLRQLRANSAAEAH